MCGNNVASGRLNAQRRVEPEGMVEEEHAAEAGGDEQKWFSDASWCLMQVFAEQLGAEPPAAKAKHGA